jgi:hypothetical protein
MDPEKVEVTQQEEDPLCLECPHCKAMVVVYRHEIRCKIFRHGVFKDTMQPMDPHTPKELCDAYAREERIYGCGRPFFLVEIIKDGKRDYRPEICGYI